jgi:hypothetical protein
LAEECLQIIDAGILFKPGHFVLIKELLHIECNILDLLFLSFLVQTSFHLNVFLN